MIDVVEIGMERVRKPFIWPEHLWKLTRLNKMLSYLYKNVNDIFIPILKERISVEASNEMNFVDIMKRENKTALNFDEIYHNSLQLIFAVSINYPNLT